MTDAPLTLLISRTLRRIVVKRKLPVAYVAQLAGINPRTAERFLDGVTFEPSTANAVAAGLRVSLFEEERASLLGGLPLWRLRDSDELWARLADVALLLETHRSRVVRRVCAAVSSGALSEAQVRHGVRDGDAIVLSQHNWLTKSPRGCSMVDAPGSLWLLLTSQGEAGRRARGALVESEAGRARRDGEFR